MLRLHRLTPQPRQRPGGVRQVRRPLTLQIGQQHQPVRARCRLHRQVGKALQIRQPQQFGCPAQRPYRVQRGDDGQVHAGRVGEGGDHTAPVDQRLGMHGHHGPGRAQRHDRVPEPDAETERRRHGLAGPDGDHEPLGRRTGRVRRADHLRQHHLVPEGQLDEIGPVGTGRRRPVPRAGRPAPVGGSSDRPAQQLPHQPVVRLQEDRRALRVLGLGPGHPAQLGHRLRGLRHTAHRLRPRLAPAERVDEVGRRDLRPLVAADHRRTHGVALRVQRYDGVLLSRDTDRLHALQQPAARGLAQGQQPGLRVDVGRPADALGALHRMRRISLPEHGSGVRVTDDDTSEIG